MIILLLFIHGLLAYLFYVLEKPYHSVFFLGVTILVLVFLLWRRVVFNFSFPKGISKTQLTSLSGVKALFLNMPYYTSALLFYGAIIGFSFAVSQAVNISFLFLLQSLVFFITVILFVWILVNYYIKNSVVWSVMRGYFFVTGCLYVFLSILSFSYEHIGGGWFLVNVLLLLFGWLLLVFFDLKSSIVYRKMQIVISVVLLFFGIGQPVFSSYEYSRYLILCFLLGVAVLYYFVLPIISSFYYIENKGGRVSHFFRSIGFLLFLLLKISLLFSMVFFPLSLLFFVFLLGVILGFFFWIHISYQNIFMYLSSVLLLFLGYIYLVFLQEDLSRVGYVLFSLLFPGVLAFMTYRYTYRPLDRYILQYTSYAFMFFSLVYGFVIMDVSIASMLLYFQVFLFSAIAYFGQLQIRNLPRVDQVISLWHKNESSGEV